MIAMIIEFVMTLKYVIILLAYMLFVLIHMGYLAFMVYIIDPIVKWISDIRKKICRKNK